jgi:hypothetical protein
VKLAEIMAAAGCSKASASDFRRVKRTQHVPTRVEPAELAGLEVHDVDIPAVVARASRSPLDAHLPDNVTATLSTAGEREDVPGFDLTTCLARLSERNRGRTEADVRDLLLYGEFDLGEEQVRLESPAADRRRIDVEHASRPKPSVWSPR